MAGRPHWYFWLIGSTNRVQPYCRLAMATMQAIPTTNCNTRYPRAACAALPPMAAVLIGSPLLRRLIMPTPLGLQGGYGGDPGDARLATRQAQPVGCIGCYER